MASAALPCLTSPFWDLANAGRQEARAIGDLDPAVVVGRDEVDRVDDVIDLLGVDAPGGAQLLVDGEVPASAVFDLSGLVGNQQDLAAVAPRKALDRLDREHQRDVVRVVGVPVPTRESRLLDATDHHIRFGSLDARQDVIQDLDPSFELQILVAPLPAAVQLLSVKLEFGIGAERREVALARLAHMLVEDLDLCLVDDQREDEVDRLRRVVEAPSRISCLVHIRESHPRLQNDFPCRARPLERGPRLATRYQLAAGSGSQAGGRIGGVWPG